MPTLRHQELERLAAQDLQDVDEVLPVLIGTQLWQQQDLKTFRKQQEGFVHAHAQVQADTNQALYASLIFGLAHLHPTCAVPFILFHT